MGRCCAGRRAEIEPTMFLMFCYNLDSDWGGEGDRYVITNIAKREPLSYKHWLLVEKVFA